MEKKKAKDNEGCNEWRWKKLGIHWRMVMDCSFSFSIIGLEGREKSALYCIAHFEIGPLGGIVLYWTLFFSPHVLVFLHLLKTTFLSRNVVVEYIHSSNIKMVLKAYIRNCIS